jgi:excisionase family DNA binding protein
MAYKPRTTPTTPTENKLFLTATEAGELLGLQPVTVCRMARRGEVKAAFIGRGYLFRRTDLDAYVEAMVQSRAA